MTWFLIWAAASGAVLAWNYRLHGKRAPRNGYETLYVLPLSTAEADRMQRISALADLEAMRTGKKVSA